MTAVSDRVDVAEHGMRLAAAAADRTSAEPPTVSVPDLEVATAYEIQDAVVGARVRAGHPVVGAKLGLTSVAKQKQMNVGEPIYGWLTADMRMDVGQPLECARFGQPRVEPEVAFVLGRDLEGPGVGAAEVLAATAAVTVALDVLDSRYSGYKFTLPDVVADNASAAGFVLGGTVVEPRGIDLRLVGCVLEVNGALMATASGAAVLGHPAAAVAWLARSLAARGHGLTAGQVVMAGALTEAFKVGPGDSVVVRIDRLGTIEVPCV
ncbi:MAG: fumarylacetoacetate hydrolase family protein [Actinomycetota bacterium]|nr:fumarylacetoacetate hydrolase family protein [Actinomycetota bacterium]